MAVSVYSCGCHIADLDFFLNTRNTAVNLYGSAAGTHGTESSLRSCQSLIWSRNLLPFMEPVFSLSWSRELASGPYPS
jgi:hypothetical protein